MSLRIACLLVMPEYKPGDRDKDWLYAVLDSHDKNSAIKAIITGMARGADMLAWEWAKDRRVHTDEFHADWQKHGKRAGPIRNLEMLRHGMPDLVIAFPGGKGTSHMVGAALVTGVPVIDLMSATP
jgi:hypothetical protein